MTLATKRATNQETPATPGAMTRATERETDRTRVAKTRAMKQETDGYRGGKNRAFRRKTQTQIQTLIDGSRVRRPGRPAPSAMLTA